MRRLTARTSLQRGLLSAEQPSSSRRCGGRAHRRRGFRPRALRSARGALAAVSRPVHPATAAGESKSVSYTTRRRGPARPEKNPVQVATHDANFTARLRRTGTESATIPSLILIAAVNRKLRAAIAAKTWEIESPCVPRREARGTAFHSARRTCDTFWNARRFPSWSLGTRNRTREGRGRLRWTCGSVKPNHLPRPRSARPRDSACYAGNVGSCRHTRTVMSCGSCDADDQDRVARLSGQRGYATLSGVNQNRTRDWNAANRRSRAA